MGIDTDGFLKQLSQIVERLQPEHQAQARQSLSNFLQAGGNSLEGIIEMLHHGDTRMRVFACWMLGQLQAKNAASPLLVTFKDKKVDVIARSQAAVALSMLGSKRPVKPLISAIRHSNEDFVREYAVYILGWLNDERGVEPLMDILKNDKESSRLRAQAAESLGHLGTAHAAVSISLLISTMQDTSPEVRFWVAFALGELGDQTALHTLEHHAKNDTSVIPGWGSVDKEAREAINLIKIREVAKG